ncbi:MAG TPA: PEP-CTERM sorting domain-containing protein [Verrucomicrobiota bacterium]|jgi:hypothetical protein|nr:PEP-CTERM sorting domain-containing protein [Sedimentisphaerales bacterium]HPC54241.1 PEP-CTERM sorting domain-containing protein [Verrucomicrobiota bacterium]HRR65837.1 PEP-CTERM sorting domain-containing protein [Candidatus Paceibacterota bacterium]HQE89084.1 PEP-CTERM sorting domain-containing protein [Verrucomicrobiota bacterium]HQH01640.1 PEP-CTERM sorting domain-containing protein [Verrucomicrobiota bacterium]
MSRRFLNIVVIAAAWLGSPQPSCAQGTVVFNEPATPIPLFTTGFAQYYSFDLDGDSATDFTFTYSFQFLGVQPEGTGRILTWLDPPPNVGGSVAPLPLGFVIGAGSETGNLAWYGHALDYNTLAICFDVGCAGAFVGQHAYMGVEFQHAGATHYGWVLLNVAQAYPSGVIESWAWDTRPSASIFAGAVPEPSTWTLFGIGALAIALLRRRC